MADAPYQRSPIPKYMLSRKTTVYLYAQSYGSEHDWVPTYTHEEWQYVFYSSQLGPPCPSPFDYPDPSPEEARLRRPDAM